METGSAPLVPDERGVGGFGGDRGPAHKGSAMTATSNPPEVLMQPPSFASAGGDRDDISLSCHRRCIRSLLVLQVLVSAANSWAFGALFDVNIFLQSGSNTFVGLVESLKGITGLAGAVPLGYLADRYPREKLLAASAWLGVAITMFTSFGLLIASFPLIVLGVALFAVYLQSVNGTINALLADLVPPGHERARIMGYQAVMVQVGMGGGPLVQLIVLMITQSKAWDVHELNGTLVVGMLPMLMALPVALYLRKALPKAMSDVAQVVELGADDVNTESPSRQECSASSAADVVPAWALKRYLGGRLELRWAVILLVEGTFIITLLITGTSVKYFALFFKEDFGFTPIGLCALNSSFPVVVALVVPFCVRLAQRLGSIAGIVAWTLLGGGFQVAFAGSTTAWAAVVFFLARHAFMKSRDPLYQALLYDCLEPRQRGRFGSVLGLRGISWAGSAAIGGYILDQNGSDYRQPCSVSLRVALRRIPRLDDIQSFSVVTNIPMWSGAGSGDCGRGQSR